MTDSGPQRRFTATPRLSAIEGEPDPLRACLGGPVLTPNQTSYGRSGLLRVKAHAVRSVRPAMAERKSKAAEYRRQAAACLEVAEHMSLKDDRTHVLQMAQQWLDLARRAEAGEE